MADNNEDNIDNEEVFDPQVEDEVSQVADPPQTESLLDDFDGLTAEGQEEAIRALIARYESTRRARETANVMAGGSNTTGIDPSGAGGVAGSGNVGPNANQQRLSGGGSGSGRTNISTAAVGGGNHAAATPATTQSSMFTLTQDVSDAAIEKEAFIVPKEKREPEDTKLGRIQKENATAGMDDKFDVMVHQSTYSGGGESKRSANQSVTKQLTSIVQLAEAGRKHCTKHDMAGICVISYLLETGIDPQDPRTWWNHGGTDCLWTSWEAIPRDRASDWQYTLNKRGTAVDRQSDRWLFAFLENSCTLDLRSRVEKALEDLPSNRRGGILYLWTILTTMFNSWACVSTPSATIFNPKLCPKSMIAFAIIKSSVSGANS